MDILNLMNIFVAVVEEGSFTSAAKRLGKTKALLSTQVSHLEQKLSVKLLQRTTRSIQITESGQAYYHEAKRILADIDNLEASVLAQTQQLSGTLRISAPITYGEEILMPLISETVITHPLLNIELKLTDRHVDLIHEGYDLALRIGHLQDSNLIARQLNNSHIVMCAAPEFLAQHPLPKTPEDLQHLPCIIDENYASKENWQFCKRQATTPMTAVTTRKVNSAVVVNNARAACLLAVHGTGIAAMPDFIASRYLKSGKLAHVLPEYTLGLLPIHVVYPSREFLPNKVRFFIAALQEFLQK